MGLSGYKNNGCKEEVYSKKEVDDMLKKLNFDVDLSGIEEQVQTANTNASTALSTANTANSTANTANSTANSAKTTANTANTTANNAMNKANSNATSITNIQTAHYGEPTMANGSSLNWYQLEEKNGFVHVLIDLNNTIIGGASKHVCTLPSNIRPTSQKTGLVFMGNAGHFHHNSFVVGTDGKVNIYNGSTVDMVNIKLEMTYIR